MILLTGSTGLLGGQLLSLLNDSGKEVRALVRRVPSQEELMMRGIRRPELIEWIVGDVTDVESVGRAMKGISLVIHCAAFVSFKSKDKAA